MDRRGPLLPFAFKQSNDDEQQQQQSQPLTSLRRRLIKPPMSMPPSLKRKMGASFNENDDLKRHELEWWLPPALNEPEDSRFKSVDISLLNLNLNLQLNPNHSLHNQSSIYGSNQSPHQQSSFQGSSQARSLSQNLSYHLSHQLSSTDIDEQVTSDRDYEATNSSHESLSPNIHPTILPPSLPVLEQPMSELDFSTQDINMPRSPPLASALASEIDIATNMSSEADFGIDQFHRFKHLTASIHAGDPDGSTLQSRQASYDRARLKILECFEEVQTVVNLEQMLLYDVPTEIKDLNSMVVFLSSVAQFPFQLYLTGNFLTELCPALFKFIKLNVLVLRQNRLSHIPPCVSKLVNLVDLSTSNNRIPFYPHQILHLNRLESFRAGPNPLLAPSAFDLCSETAIDSPNSRHKRVAISKLDVVATSKASLKLPSLKSLCLHAIALYDVSYQETMNWKKHTPKAYHNLIASAISKGRFMDTCSECPNIVVEPYAELFEWWDMLLNKAIPVRRQFCCGVCVETFRSGNNKSTEM